MNDAAAIARLAAARSRLTSLGAVTVVARGYATLDLDEAERDVRATMAPRRVRRAADDTLLGARCRIVETADEPWIVLLEPATEGRVAASLARYGQVAVAEYLIAASDGGNIVTAAATAGIALSPPGRGPLGAERLVLGAPPWGPHLILLDEAPPGAAGPRRATIER